MATDTEGEERSPSDSGRRPSEENGANDPSKVDDTSTDGMTRATDPIPSHRTELDRGQSAHGRRHNASCSSIVDGLLFEIYDRWQRDAAADSDTFTEYSSTSDAFLGRFDSVPLDFEQSGLNRTYLEAKDVDELRQLKSDMQHRVTQISARLIRQLKSRDRLLARIKRHYDVITAILQASSPKRRVDSKIRFSIEPLSGDSDAFEQWRDAMRAVAKLPMGIPSEFRRKVWLSLADNHIANMRIDWEKTKRFAFNERSNPDDNKLGLQIVKDLHRTGCRGFTGEDSEQDRACLKRVLLAYARWNKHVGYCQGFNIIAALILEVVDRKEEDALKVMIYLIDHVLPESYFANNLRALSVDMAVFRELLHIQLPLLSRHLDRLQVAARDHNTGANYEPPLTNVFTMQWFLTLFATCLPKTTALRLWDCVLLENSDVLLRTALAIWAKLKSRIMRVESADEFYTAMGSITHDMLNNSIIGADELIKTMYSLAPDAFQHLSDLREKYTYNITPFTAAMATGKRPNKSAVSFFSDDDDDDDSMDNITCFTGIFPPQVNRSTGDANRTSTGSRSDISKVGLGAYEVTPPLATTAEGTAYAERMTLDLHTLHQQYSRLRERQKQAHIILAAASAKHAASVLAESQVVAPIESPVVVNHLFVRRKPGSGGRNRTIAGAPQIAPMYACSGIVNAQLGVKTLAIARAKSLLEAQRRNTGQNAASTQNDAATQNDRVKRTHQRKDSTDSEVSNTSSVCGRSSTSSGSTVCASESDAAEVSLSKSESDIAAKSEDMKDLIWLSDAVDGDAVNGDAVDGDTVDGDTVNGHVNGDTVVDNDDSESHKSEAEKVCGQEEGHGITDDSDIGDNDTDIGDIRDSCEGAEADDVIAFDEAKDVDKLQQDRCGVEGNITQYSNNHFCLNGRPSGDNAVQPISRGTHLTRSNAAEKHQVDSTCDSKTKQKDPGIRDGVVNTECHPTLLQLARGWTPPPGDSTDMENGNDNLSIQHVSRSTSPHTERVFNPFPSVHVSQRRTRNGMRLGLYSTENIPKLETGLVVGSGVKQIGRAQINACLHHHYMADMRQKARKTKR